ncbi:MAG: hypothetical protein IJN43_05120 [Ruminococcus sp.]|nr:hypothetical protein [Ruminococcus sp.]
MFEQEFMKINKTLLSLCLEFSQNKADYIFVYLYMKKEQYFFNSFFRFGKEIWDIDDLEYPRDCVKRFMQLINEETAKFPLLFEGFKREKPILYKMMYQCNTQKFNFSLKYDGDIASKFFPEQDFDNWIESVKDNGPSL